MRLHADERTVENALQLVSLGTDVGCLAELQCPLERGGVGRAAANEVDNVSELQPMSRVGMGFKGSESA